MIEVRDRAGKLQDMAWVKANYGNVEIAPIEGAGYRVVKLIETEGQIVFHATVLNDAGGPVSGIPVRYEWPDDHSDEITNGSGMAEHTAGGGEKYFPPAKGAISWQVREFPSEKIDGLGWLGGTQYRHLNPTFRWSEGDSEPEPPPSPEGGILENLYTVLVRIADALEAEA